MPVDQLAVADQPTGSRCLQRAHSAVRALTYDPVGQPAGDLPNSLLFAYYYNSYNALSGIEFGKGKLGRFF